MIVLEVTVINLAPPPAQAVLVFTNADRHWIVTAYGPSFGSLLLFGAKSPALRAIIICRVYTLSI